jgi:DMSO/TMAO reductase YedYZ molybdopterin-dependent catalytic subunit
MKMHSGRIGFGIAALALTCALASLPARAQNSAPTSAHGAQPAAVSSTAASSLQVVREIDDPNNGNRWILVRDWASPGGPGRLLLLAGSSAAAQHAPAPEARPSAPSPPPSAPALAAVAFAAPPSPAFAAPVIHPGDALIVEEKTPILEAWLAATALGTAPVGAQLSARLEIGGKVIRVRALAPGRATLNPEIGTEP